jgi:hypothetical protein
MPSSRAEPLVRHRERAFLFGFGHLLIFGALADRWSLEIVNLEGYHLTNAYMLEHWVPSRRAGRRRTRFSTSPSGGSSTLSIDPTDPAALNGLGSILFFERDRARSRTGAGESTAICAVKSPSGAAWFASSPRLPGVGAR